ncbi:twin-arginine translocase TatA/TatE family subunit [Fusibacter paucivorans]|uniref:Twin-arginine translocase TatA/TatE family subunit n=1 Tax=Fusibacter paucivorans TaxID=76009 RepID=A0ABS5PMI5_9FIRM|nr:twin-arginine translocase TatA/TatE family subunit [Fusibacter paucivorans]MBS7526389.1 twin-arginine translocase TatA/TatE family subunit [Fusibacter paucivorans]
MRLGTNELMLILLIALVIFGPTKLPELGKLAGSMMGTVKKQIDSMGEEIKEVDEIIKETVVEKGDVS